MSNASKGIMLIRYAFITYLLGNVIIIALSMIYEASYLTSIINSTQSSPTLYSSSLVGISYVLVAIDAALTLTVALLELLGFRALSSVNAFYVMGIYGALMQIFSIPLSLFYAIISIKAIGSGARSISSFSLQPPLSINPQVSLFGVIGAIIEVVGWIIVLISTYRLGSEYSNYLIKVGSALMITGLPLIIAPILYIWQLINAISAINTIALLAALGTIVLGGLLEFIGIIILLIGLGSLIRMLKMNNSP